MKSLRGKKVFIAGIADDKGLGWAIAKSLAELGCEIIIGTWVPLYKIFSLLLKNRKLDLTLSDGSEMNIAKIYPIDASFDTREDIPQEVLENKRYKAYDNFAIKEVCDLVQEDFGTIDFLVHSLANSKEITSPLLETTRSGYLDAMNASSYSFISLVRHFSEIMNPHGSILNLTYLASTKIVPGYGGGMSSAKAALESDTRTLAYEITRKYPEKKLRINSISSGAIASRAAKATGFIDEMIEYGANNSPLQEELNASSVGKTARFLLSADACAITASTIYVDNGLHALAAIPQSNSNAANHIKESLLGI